MNYHRLTQQCASVVVLLGLLTAGCATNKPQAWNIVLTKSTPATIPVDLIGVRPADEAEWAGMDIDSYWSPASQLRKDANPLTYSLKMGEPVVLQKNDPRWKEWLSHGARKLLIIANLPDKYSPGPADPRRKFLPLRKKDWEPGKKNTLEIELKQTGIRVLTPQTVSD